MTDVKTPQKWFGISGCMDIPSAMRRLACSTAFLLAIPLFALGQSPAWWTNRAVLTTNAVNDYAAINQGQVKWLATRAAVEFSNDVTGFALPGSNILSLVSGFTPSNNYCPVNLGQLKTVAKPFYDFLWDYGLTNVYPAGARMPYPWSGSTNPPNDYAPVNIGQTKHLFSFNAGGLTASWDSDHDGLPDWWERAYFGGLTQQTAATDADSDDLPNGWEYRYGLNPTNAADAYEDLDDDYYLNIYEYKRGTDPSAPASIPTATRYVSLDGNDNFGNDGTWPFYPLLTIQRALAEVTDDCEIIEVAGFFGTPYTAVGDKELFTNCQKRVMIRSQFGPDSGVIDCQGTGRGGVFDNWSGVQGQVICGFTITNANHGVWAAGAGVALQAAMCLLSLPGLV